MIPVARVPEPPGFDAEVRQPGQRWLLQNAHPGKRLPELWRPFCGHLAEGFKNLCGYSAMYVDDGTVDHFRSVRSNRMLAYEWSNYRYASHRLNSMKQEREVLDPYEVAEGWFEVLLPSLQLALTDKVPADKRPLAEETLRIMRLVHDERIVRRRRGWYEMYQRGQLTLEGLRTVAPLIAAAVEKQLPREQP